MATTTNFGWETPDDTDLVKDGAAAIRTALGGVDTSFVDLKGGTTGQILSKASATDLDFTWVAPNPGDITGVSVTAPITGGGTSGDVTIGIDSTAVVPSQTGNAGKYLTTNGSVSSWGTIAGGSLTLLSTTAITGVATISITSISQSYKDLFIYIDNFRPDRTGNLRINPYNTSTVLSTGVAEYRWANGSGQTVTGSTGCDIVTDMTTTSVGRNVCAFTINQYTASQNHAITGRYGVYATGGFGTGYSFGGFNGATWGTGGANPINRIDFSWSSAGNFTAQGNIYIYGVN